MRVAVVAEETARHVESDVTDRLGRLAELLTARAHNVRVFCRAWWDGDADEFSANGLNYRAVTHEPGPPRRFATCLPNSLRSYNPDVIHAAYDNPAAVITASISSTVLRVPYLIEWYDTTPQPGWRRRVQALAVRAPDLVVTPSRLVETGVRELGRSRDKIDVIPTPIDMELIRETPAESIGDIVYARTLDEHANLGSLLLSLAELRELDWQAVVIGDGPLRDQYEQQAADLRIENRVRFVGAQPAERRIRIYKGAHVYVHTALKTPFATELLQALACGCVGIAEYHAESSAHELIEHNERGFRVTDENDLTAAITEAANLPRKDVDETFADYDESSILERYLARYRGLQSAYGLL